MRKWEGLGGKTSARKSKNILRIFMWSHGPEGCTTNAPRPVHQSDMIKFRMLGKLQIFIGDGPFEKQFISWNSICIFTRGYHGDYSWVLELYQIESK